MHARNEVLRDLSLKNYIYDLCKQNIILFFSKVQDYVGWNTESVTLNSSRIISGSTIPEPYISVGETIILQFITDSSVTYQGFEIAYEIIADSGGKHGHGERSA